MRYGSYAYLLDRLRLYGVDDVVLLTSLPHARQVAPALLDDGFEAVYEGEELVLLHRDGTPRAYIISQRVLGIGRGARLWAFLFPQILVGTSSRVDDYTLEELRRYDVLLLSGFTWRNRDVAERLVEAAAGTGVCVIVDLTGVPVDPLARIPRFLGVWGEQIILDDRPVTARVGSQNIPLRPFAAPSKLWYTHVPQGVDVETVTFDYLGERGTVIGYRQVGAGQVWFVGLNLSYHALTTGDETALRLLADVVRLDPRAPSSLIAVPLASYRATAEGYRFTYTLDQTRWLLLPVAALDGTRVFVDGEPTETRSLETLVLFRAPAGTHAVEVRLVPTPVYRAGQGVTLAGAIVLLGLMWWQGRRVLHRTRKVEWTPGTAEWHAEKGHRI
ncbi:MAG: 6-pyruvoyl-tetrahydropterin synthase-related protein [Ardenticatenia bacterium]|nr:6-pyruvoyl-tetrahydropterin synthase-related protein [Ardenticatenia bacterium]